MIRDAISMRARQLQACALTALLFPCLCGCMIIPNVERFEPKPPLRDPYTYQRTGEPKRVTVLFDAQTHQPIDDAYVVLVINRTAATIPDSGMYGCGKRPFIVVKPYDKLNDLSYTYVLLYVFAPIHFALGAEYFNGGVFIYRAGYVPATYPRRAPIRAVAADNGPTRYVVDNYPERMALEPSPPSDSRRLLLLAVREAIDDRWWPRMERTLNARLDRLEKRSPR